MLGLMYANCARTTGPVSGTGGRRAASQHASSREPFRHLSGKKVASRLALARQATRHFHQPPSRRMITARHGRLMACSMVRVAGRRTSYAARLSRQHMRPPHAEEAILRPPQRYCRTSYRRACRTRAPSAGADAHGLPAIRSMRVDASLRG